MWSLRLPGVCGLLGNHRSSSKVHEGSAVIALRPFSICVFQFRRALLITEPMNSAKLPIIGLFESEFSSLRVRQGVGPGNVSEVLCHQSSE
jgi:hypothetical protein